MKSYKIPTKLPEDFKKAWMSKHDKTIQFTRTPVHSKYLRFYNAEMVELGNTYYGDDYARDKYIPPNPMPAESAKFKAFKACVENNLVLQQIVLLIEQETEQGKFELFLFTEDLLDIDVTEPLHKVGYNIRSEYMGLSSWYYCISW